MKYLNSTVMYVFCGDCRKFMHTKDGQGQYGESHGLCPKCLEITINKINELHERKTTKAKAIATP